MLTDRLSCTLVPNQDNAVVDESSLTKNVVVDMTVASFGYFREDVRYFIEVTGDKTSTVNGVVGAYACNRMRFILRSYLRLHFETSLRHPSSFLNLHTFSRFESSVVTCILD